MNQGDKQRFQLAMHLYEITFNSEFDRAKLAGYFMALEDLTIEAVEIAVKETLKAEKRTPPPAVIREYAMKFYRPIPDQKKIAQFTMADITPTTAFGKACSKLLQKLFSGDITEEIYFKEASKLLESNGHNADELNDQLYELQTGEKYKETPPF